MRPTIADDLGEQMLWIKFAFVAALAATGWIAALRLARPGRALGRVPAALAVPVAVMWLLAAIALAGADAPHRAALVLGRTWSACPFNIAVLAAPVFVAALWGLKGFAPTRLRLAGAAAGLVAGAAGAFVYTFHCPELAAPFLGDLVRPRHADPDRGRRARRAARAALVMRPVGAQRACIRGAPGATSGGSVSATTRESARSPCP